MNLDKIEWRKIIHMSNLVFVWIRHLRFFLSSDGHEQCNQAYEQ